MYFAFNSSFSLFKFLKSTYSWGRLRPLMKLLKFFITLKKIDSKLPCFCSVIDHRGCQNLVRTSVTHSTAPRVPLFCSYHILTSSVIYYWIDARQLGIYLLSKSVGVASLCDLPSVTHHNKAAMCFFIYFMPCRILMKVNVWWQ